MILKIITKLFHYEKTLHIPQELKHQYPMPKYGSMSQLFTGE